MTHRRCCCGSEIWVLGYCCHSGDEDFPCSGVDPADPDLYLGMVRLSWIIENGFPISADGLCTDTPGPGDFWDGSLTVTVRDDLGQCWQFFAYASTPGGPYNVGQQCVCTNPACLSTPCVPDGDFYRSVETDDPTKISCRCCDCDPDTPCFDDDFEDDLPDWPPVRPVPDPIGPDFNHCFCPSPTGCTNWWLDSDENLLLGTITPELRVRVAMRLTGTMRIRGLRTNSDGVTLDQYDEVYSFDEIMDSEQTGDACSATASVAYFDTISLGARSVGRIFSASVSWDTTNGLFMDLSCELNDGAPQFGTNGPNHRISMTGVGGVTTTDGWVASVDLSGTVGDDEQTAPLTIPVGPACVSRYSRQAPNLHAIGRSPASGVPHFEGETEILSLRAEVRIANIIPCSAIPGP